MPLYRKKPIVIEAFCFGIDDMPDWFVDKRTTGDIVTHGTYDHISSCDIQTLEGVMQGKRGDYIIKGIQGEIYPCKPDIFLATYEKVEETVTQESTGVRWQGEEDGTVLICDDVATLPVGQLGLGMPPHILAEAARVLGVLGRRALAQTPGRMRPFGEMCEEYHQALEAAIEAEQRLAKERAENIAQSFVWLEEEIPHGQSEAEDESREAEKS